MPLYNPPITALTSSTATPTSVASSAASVTILAANTGRKGGTIFNNSTANLYIEFAAAATVTAFLVKIAGGGYYEIPFGYAGIISGLWDAVNGTALVNEFT